MSVQQRGITTTDEDSLDTKLKPTKLLRTFFEIFYPSTEDMKEDYVSSSRILRRMLEAVETILSSSDFERLEIEKKIPEILARLEECEEGSEEYKKVSAEIPTLFKDSFQALAESDNEDVRNASVVIMEGFPELADVLGGFGERFQRILIEPFGLSVIEPEFPQIEKTTKGKEEG